MTEKNLLEYFAKFSHDPLGFVKVAFPWTKKGTVLEKWEGPESWQQDVLESIGRRSLNPDQAIREATVSGNGVGKALGNDEPVLTPTGWRKISSLAVGDEVIAGDGTTTIVTGVFPQGERDLYRVTMNDGSSVLADADHQWLTENRHERRRDGGRKGGTPKVRTTKEIAATLTFPNGSTIGLNHQIPTAQPVQHPKALLPIEPYLFGCWLGDGDAKGRITGMADLHRQLFAAGARMGEAAISWHTGSFAVCRGAHGIQDGLRALGLFDCRSWEKRIPEVYLRADISQRTALLQGLLDTDGFVGKNGHVCHDTTSKQLADDMAELARSLGGVVRRTGRQGRLNGVDKRWVYKVTISLPEGIAPFRLPRKVGRYKPKYGNGLSDRSRKRFIASIEPEGRGLATCIAVAHPSKLYITRDYIVTHNTALVCWIILWAITTMEDTKGVITANTETQLKTKTWAELGKWYHLFLAKEHFKLTATAIFSVDDNHERTWRIDMVPWSENNVVAFQGLHNEGKRLLMIYDEASGIPDGIWEAGDGCMTDKSTERIWCVFGNPNRPQGRFRECFPGGRFSHSWNSRCVDSRSISFTDKSEFNQWISDYGEDSDFVRVRVRGVFPRSGSMQFIDSETVNEATKRDVPVFLYEPLVIGVDVARFGDDQSVIYVRKGRDGRSIPPLKLRNVDTMTLAGRVSELFKEYRADAIFVDGGGVGGGVVDRLRQLHVPVIDVQFGSKADGIGFASGDGGVQYANKRAEIWGSMRAWLKGGAIPDDPGLIVQLTNLEYGYNVRNEIQLEKKEDMKKRGLESPDIADALALTFAHVVQAHENAGHEGPHDDLIETEYNPFTNESIWDEDHNGISPLN